MRPCGSRPKIGGVYRQHFGDTVLEAGQTYHVAVTYDGANQRVYVNGELDSTPRAQTGSADTNNTNISIGTVWDGSSDPADAVVDEVAVYPTALSAATIAAHYALGVGEAEDTAPPTAPTGLSATAAGATQANLSWTASSDNVGVTEYRVERCAGAGCTNFAQVGNPDRHLVQRRRPRPVDRLPLSGARRRRRHQPEPLGDCHRDHSGLDVRRRLSGAILADSPAGYWRLGGAVRD